MIYIQKENVIWDVHWLGNMFIAVFICYTIKMKHLRLEDRMRLQGMILWWVDRKKMSEVLQCSDRTIRREIYRWSVDGV